MQEVRCRCGRLLGRFVDGLFVTRHKKLELVCGDIRAIRCPECGVTVVPSPHTVKVQAA